MHIKLLACRHRMVKYTSLEIHLLRFLQLFFLGFLYICRRPLSFVLSFLSILDIAIVAEVQNAVNIKKYIKVSNDFIFPYVDMWQALEAMAAKQNGKIVCPRTRIAFDISQVKKAYVF